MSSNYIYHGEPERRVFRLLPEDDYQYVVSECDEPYQKDNGKWVLKVTLVIQPSGTTVVDHPWCGVTSAGDHRDGIASFLVSCNRAPAIGEQPDWKRIVSAKGKLRLIQEEWEGKKNNKVHYYYAPKQVGPTAEQAPRQSYSQEEYNKASAEAVKKAGGPVRPDLEPEPDNIPF